MPAPGRAADVPRAAAGQSLHPGFHTLHVTSPDQRYLSWAGPVIGPCSATSAYGSLADHLIECFERQLIGQGQVIKGRQGKVWSSMAMAAPRLLGGHAGEAAGVAGKKGSSWQGCIKLTST